MVDREKLANEIIRLRNKKEYSQRKLAMVSGVSNSTVSRIESANSDTDPETLKKLAPWLDVTYEELMQVAGYLKEYRGITEETLGDEDFNRILPLILKNLSDSILKYDDKENDAITSGLDLNNSWKYLSDYEKTTLLNSVIKEAKYNKTTGHVSLTKYFDIGPEGFQTIKKDYLDYLGEQEKEEAVEDKEKYAPANDIEEAMKIILEQPGLMLKGSILSDESKIILANAIQMGLKTAEELDKKKNEGDSNE